MGEFNCPACGHYHSTFAISGHDPKKVPKKCYRCQKPYPLGTPEEWAKTHPFGKQLSKD
jgi:transcription elongation factor Elf1